MKLKKLTVGFISFLVFAVFNNNVYAVAKKVSPQIKSIGNIGITITQTDSFTLPTALKAKMSNGTNKSVPVIWDKKVDYNKIGIQRFNGTIKGYKNKVLLTLNTKDEADINKIKKMSLYTFQLKDTYGEFYNVYIYEINSKKQIASFKNGTLWAGASDGDILYEGNVKIAYSKAGSNIVKVIYPTSKYMDGTRTQTINASRELVKKIENKYKNNPDLLLMGEVLCSNASGMSIYYINNGILKQFQGELSTCNAYELFFRQVNANIFETSAYNNMEGYFYVMKNEFDFDTGATKSISENKMTVQEYNDYIKNVDNNTNKNEEENNNAIEFADKITQMIKVSTVVLNKTTCNLVVGSTENLIATVSPVNATNKEVIWTSSNPEVATVDNTGKVTIISTGTADIMVTTVECGKISTCTILSEHNCFPKLPGVPQPTGLKYENDKYDSKLNEIYYSYNNENFDVDAYAKLLRTYGWESNDASMNGYSAYYGGRLVSIFYFTKEKDSISVELLRTKYGYKIIGISGIAH